MEGLFVILIIVAVVWATVNPDKLGFMNDSDLNRAENPGSPDLNSNIQITWLPNPKNHPSTPSCYIGSTGKVSKIYDDGGIELEMDTAVLIVGNKFKFKYV